MKPSSESRPSPEMAEALRSRAKGGSFLRFSDFMQTALYDPRCGYYRRDAARVGRTPGTDFFTASSSPLFGRLVAAACVSLLGGRDPSGYAFVEIGAEPEGGILRDVAHPFASARTVRLGDPMELTGKAVVFSNELFDAQPFRRFRRRGAGWSEVGVRLDGDLLLESERDGPIADGPPLPDDAPEGYVIDAPLEAAALARAVAAQPWEGLFLAFDYGKSWEEIAYGCPEGTARAYRRHTQSNDLLAAPGEQDLTCHVCWDWLRQALAGAGFAEPVVESQEAFFIHHSAALIEALMRAGASSLSPEKRSLLQLLHPAHMGQKFQALWAVRS